MNEKLATIIDTPIVYDVTDAALSEIEKKYAIVPDVSTKDGYELCKAGCSELRKLRTGVDKRRKELKADALEYCNRVEAVAKSITARIVAVEDPMKAAKDARDAEIEAEKEAKRQAEINRINAIRVKIEGIRRMAVMFPGFTAVEVREAHALLSARVLTADDFQELLPEAEQVKADTIGILDAMLERIAEQERIADEARQAAELAKAEAERVRVEQERIKAEQAAERARISAEKAEMEAAKAAAEAELRAAREAMERERAEMEAERNRIKAEKEAAEKAAQDAEQAAQIEADRLAQEEAQRAIDEQLAEVRAREEAEKAASESEQCDTTMEVHAAAKIEIVDALLKYGCPSKKAETLADALTTGMIPHMVYSLSTGAP